MSLSENKAVVRRWFEEVWNKGDLDRIDELIAPDALFKDPASGDYQGPEGARELVTMYRTGFPDTHFTIEEQVAEGELVTTRWTASATHEGDLMGIAATGKSITVNGIQVDRVSGGKLAGGEVAWDALGMLRQLGVVSETIGAQT